MTMSNDVNKMCRDDARSSSDSRLTLEGYYEREVNRLGVKNPILCYTSENETYKLSFSEEMFVLGKSERIPDENTPWNSMVFNMQRRLSTLDDFFIELFENCGWYYDYDIYRRKTLLPGVIAKHIINYFNEAQKIKILSG